MTKSKVRSKVILVVVLLTLAMTALAMTGYGRKAEAATATDFSEYFAMAPYNSIYTNEMLLREYKDAEETPRFLREYIQSGEVDTSFCTKYGELSFNLSGGGSVTGAFYAESPEPDSVCLIEFPEVNGKTYTLVRFFTEPYQTYAVPFGTDGRHFVVPFAVFDLSNTSNMPRYTVQADTASKGYQYQVAYKGRTILAGYGTSANVGNAVKNVSQAGMAGGGTVQGYYIPFQNKYVSAADITTYTLKENVVLHMVTNTYDPRGSITLPDDPTPTREGYKFFGWYFNSGYTRPYNGEAITSDTSLYAKFIRESYTVTFNTDGGETIEPITAEYGTALSELEFPVIEKPGHTFSGWECFDSTYTQSLGMLPEDLSGVTLIFNFYLKATFTANSYKATFDPNNGEEVTEKTVTYGEEVELPTAPEKTGYNFAGWYDGADKQYTGAAFTYTEDTTFTAKWEIKKFTVTFYVDGSVYKTLEVEYGTSLMSAAEKASVQATGVMLTNGLYTENLEGITVTEDLIVEGTITDWTRVKDYVVKYKGVVIGAACMVVGVIALLVITSQRKRGYRRRR